MTRADSEKNKPSTLEGGDFKKVYIMRKRLLSATVVGASALTLGAGAFAWQASTFDINGVDSAGAELQSDGCLIGNLLLTHNDPIYDTVLNDWFFTDVSVAGDTGSNATACEGYELKVSYETLAGATIQVGTVGNLPATEMFDQSVAVADGQLPGVSTENIKNWQIVIADPDSVTADAPTALSATAGNTTVALTWSAPTNDGGADITDYVIEQRIGAGSWTVINDGTSINTFYTVTGLTNETAYEFRVSTVNAVGTGTTSSSANATPVTPPTVVTSVNGQIVADSVVFTIVNGVATISGRQSGSNALSLVVPSSISYNGVVSPVTRLGAYAFFRSPVTSVTLPNSLTTIESGAFYDGKLTSLVIPNSVTLIEGSAFSENKLTSLTLGNSVVTIMNNAFYFNPLTSVTIPASVTTIGQQAFDLTQINSVFVPNTVTSLNSTAFPGATIITRG